MSSSKEIKNRIKSVKSTKKITKAMELVAASKMKRAVASTVASRLYAKYSWEVLTSVADNLEENTHPLFKGKKRAKGEKESILVILVTSNRGLCGAYNAQVLKKTLNLLHSFTKSNAEESNIDVISVGKKGDIAMRRIGKKVIASFNELPDDISLGHILPISKLAIDEYSVGNYDKVLVVYTDFVSALTQKAEVKQILPVTKSHLEELIKIWEEERKENINNNFPKLGDKIEYLFEGNIHELLGSLAEKLTQMQIYQMLLESNASEQSSRMVAMKNASDASGEMIDDLTLVFNKARQSNITREISEISAGMASVN